MSTEEDKNVTETKPAEDTGNGEVRYFAPEQNIPGFFMLNHAIFQEAEKSTKMITLHVKTPKDKKTVTTEENAVIKDVSVDYRNVKDQNVLRAMCVFVVF